MNETGPTSAYSIQDAISHCVGGPIPPQDFDLRCASYLRIKLHEVRQYYPDWYFTAIGVDRDHVHLHMEIPPRYSVSQVVDVLKSNTSRALRAKFSFLDKVYWDRGGIWAKGFFVSTVGVNEAIIKRYVQMQGVEDAGQAELEL